MKYINTKNKAVINTASICSGGDWIPYEEPKEEKPKKTPRKKTTKKVSE